MKSIFFKSVLVAAAVVALSACGGAQAAPLNENFTANPATTVFSVKDAIIVEKTTGGVNVSIQVAIANPDGSFGGYAKSTQSYSDTTGTTWNNFVAQAAANGFFKIGSVATKYYSGKNASAVNCLSSAYTQFVFLSGAEGAADSGCITFQAVKAVSN